MSFKSILDAGKTLAQKTADMASAAAGDLKAKTEQVIADAKPTLNRALDEGMAKAGEVKRSAQGVMANAAEKIADSVRPDPK